MELEFTYRSLAFPGGNAIIDAGGDGMDALWIALAVIAGLAALALLTAYICFRMAFYVKKKTIIGKDEYPIPPGKEYEPYREEMVGWMKKTNALEK